MFCVRPNTSLICSEADTVRHKCQLAGGDADAKMGVNAAQVQKNECPETA